MEPLMVGILGSILMLVLLALGVNIGMAMMAIGIGGLWVVGFTGLESYVGTSLFYSIWVYDYAVLPLFFLMGSLAVDSGIGEKAYTAIYKWFARVPGGLAITTTLGCAAFGAVSGSSMATSVLFGRISLPEMNKYGYDKSLSMGCVAAAGTFACMIPPSGMFVIYGILTETSIMRLFVAGIVPGLLTAIAYCISIIIRVKNKPHLAPIPKDVSFTWIEKITSLRDGLPVLIIAVIVLGGIYSGIFTVTEGAAAGAVVTLIMSFYFLGKKFDLRTPLVMTAQTTATIFFIMIGAFFYTRFITVTRLAFHVSEYLTSLAMPDIAFIFAIFVLYFLLGMVMGPVSIMFITLPVLFPVVVELGFNPIWFGIILMKATEIAAVTPPFGLNVYVLKSVIGGDASLEQVFRGVWPFVLVDLIVLLPLIFFPQITLWLPNLLLSR